MKRGLRHSPQILRSIVTAFKGKGIVLRAELVFILVKVLVLVEAFVLVFILVKAFVIILKIVYHDMLYPYDFEGDADN